MPFTIGGDRLPPKNQKGTLKKVRVEEQKKRGKFVTRVHNLNLEGQSLKNLVRFLKNECHCGGTCKDGVIELQGKNKEAVLKALKEYPPGDLNL